MFDFPTVRQVVSHLQGSRPAASPEVDQRAQQSGDAVQVKISGMSAAMPLGVASLAALRQMSHCGRDLLGEIIPSRWDLDLALQGVQGLAPEVAARVRYGGFVQNAQLFEHTFFGISASESLAMDPQQRMLMELSYESLHEAGRSKASLLGSGIAVNVGQWESEFKEVLMATPAGNSVYASTGFTCAVACGR
eukprot:4650675-Prymnesium_polylepis.1